MKCGCTPVCGRTSWPRVRASTSTPGMRRSSAPRTRRRSPACCPGSSHSSRSPPASRGAMRGPACGSASVSSGRRSASVRRCRGTHCSTRRSRCCRGSVPWHASPCCHCWPWGCSRRSALRGSERACRRTPVRGVSRRPWASSRWWASTWRTPGRRWHSCASTAFRRCMRPWRRRPTRWWPSCRSPNPDGSQPTPQPCRPPRRTGVRC